jgi:hypothetical protein
LSAFFHSLYFASNMLFSLNNVFAWAVASTSAIVVEGNSREVDKFEKHLGFGVQHLHGRQHGYMALQADSCANVTELRFTQAVQDNFAAIEEQTFWVAPGQRYWVNEELWGGPGFPIFVFIGGKKSTARATSVQC